MKFAVLFGLVLLDLFASVNAQQFGDLRLVGSSITGRGRLEIFFGGTWGTICSTGFTTISANTACTQLGFSRATRFGLASSFGYGVGSGSIDLTRVVCTANNNHILRCSVQLTTSSCTHSQDIGLTCGNSTPAFQYQGGVRLVDGPYRSEGRLEVFLFNRWGTVCTSNFNTSAADAVCTQLGYTNHRSYRTMSSNTTSPVWVDSIDTCSNSTPCFSSCYPNFNLQVNFELSCPHTQDVYVECEFQPAALSPAGTTSSCILVPPSNASVCFNSNAFFETRGFPIAPSKLVLVPGSVFQCDGRISGIAAAMSRLSSTGSLPFIQVWRPLSAFAYLKTFGIQLEERYITQVGSGSEAYWYYNLTFSGPDRLILQANDIIGYYHPSNTKYLIYTSESFGYVSYISNASSPIIAITDANIIRLNDKQPLIDITFEAQCINLTSPSQGRITSCTSGILGFGYEGDSCFLDCNEGYSLPNTRSVCQKGRQWSVTGGCREAPVSPGPNIPAIIGGTAGGLVVIGFILWLHFQKPKERAKIRRFKERCQARLRRFKNGCQERFRRALVFLHIRPNNFSPANQQTQRPAATPHAPASPDPPVEASPDLPTRASSNPTGASNHTGTTTEDHYDSKPPNYDEAIKGTFDEGYPEPSLVDPPPTYGFQNY